MLEKYYPFVFSNFDSFNKQDIVRLVHVVYDLRMANYDEIYELIEEYIENNLKEFNMYEISYILHTSMKSNNRRGYFSRKFCKNILGKLVENDFFKFDTPNSILEILHFLTATKSLT